MPLPKYKLSYSPEGIRHATEVWVEEIAKPEKADRKKEREIEEYICQLKELSDRREAEIVAVREHARRLGEIALLLQEKAEAQEQAANVDAELETEFRAHADKWLGETGALSDPVRKFMHPSHLKIIGMGIEVLPLILKEVEKMSGHWFVALDAISPVNPVRPEDESDFQGVAKAWLDWGKGEGLI
jgi:hypothetical protein